MANENPGGVSPRAGIGTETTPGASGTGASADAHNAQRTDKIGTPTPPPSGPAAVKDELVELEKQRVSESKQRSESEKAAAEGTKGRTAEEVRRLGHAPGRFPEESNP